jgi:ATP/maltotriose-dependent transcriptional regulator MalT
VDRCEDPMARTSFLNSCAIVLTLNGHYAQAHAVASKLVTEAEEFRLRFVLPYGFLRMASVAAGKRRFGEAFNSLEKAETLAAEVSDRWMSDAIPAVRAMVHLSAGDAHRAVRVAQSGDEGTPSIRAEVLGIQALALACTGDVTRARTLANEARATSVTLEAASLGLIADAVAACVLGSSESGRASTAAFQFAVERGTVDHFVTAYRAFPNLIEPIATDDDPQIAQIMQEASDKDLARQMGIVIPRHGDALTTVLSPREREVFELMASGLTNKAIASKLYISESTTKVHVRHIFEKLNAQTRTEAVRKGRERLEYSD